MSADRETLAVYAERAEDYANLVQSEGAGKDLKAFIAALPPRAHVLDLGCGPGFASAHMAKAGLRPDPVDASPEMVALARNRFGLPARIARFDQIEGEDIYDGVWASFSLLHAPRAAFPGHLDALHKALKPGGRLYLGMKLGSGEQRDAIGRFYTFYSEDELRDHLEHAGFTVASSREGADKGLAGTIDPFIIIQAQS